MFWSKAKDIAKNRLKKAASKVYMVLKIVLVVLLLFSVTAITYASVKHTFIAQIIAGAILGFMAGLPFLAYVLAKSDLFFTIVEEGTMKVITCNGQFTKAIMRYEGFHLDEKWNVKKNGATSKTPWWQKFTGGIVWIGIWPFYRVHEYDFRWQVKRSYDDKGKVVKRTEAKEEKIKHIFSKASSYSALLDSVMTKGMFPANVDLNIIARITNPHKAIFRAHQWYEFMIAMLLPHVRQFLATKSFEDLAKIGQLKNDKLYRFLEHSALSENQKETIRTELNAEGFSDTEITKELEERNLGVLGVLRERYGIDIISVKFEDIDPSDERYKSALSKSREAELEANRIDKLNTAIAKHGDQAKFIRYMETLEKLGESPSKTIIPLGLQSILDEIKNMFGGGKS